MTALGGRRNIAARVLIVAGLAMAMLGAAGLVAHAANPESQAGSSCAVAVSTSEATTCVVRSDGTVWCWGDNRYGQLGNGTTSLDIPAEISAVQVLREGDDPGSRPPLTDVVAIAAGQVHECALRSDGTVWCWGYHYYGNLGNGASGVTPGLDCHTEGGCGTPYAVRVVSDQGDPLQNVQKVIAGRMHTCALQRPLTDGGGTVWCWGSNGVGELGDGTTVDRSTPVQVTQRNARTRFADAADVAAGGHSSCASKGDESAWCWGWNYYGEVGDGTTRTRKSAVQVKTSKRTLLPADVRDVTGGYGYNCARRRDTSVWCWGGFEPFAHPVLQGGSPFLGTEELAAHVTHTCARTADGAVWCWGDNSWGQLGDGSGLSSAEPVQVLLPPNEPAIGLSRGSYAFYTCARRQDLSVWCWGHNEYGQLGDGSFAGSPYPVKATVFDCL